MSLLYLHYRFWIPVGGISFWRGAPGETGHLVSCSVRCTEFYAMSGAIMLLQMAMACGDYISWRSWERRWIDEVVHCWNSINLSSRSGMMLRHMFNSGGTAAVHDEPEEVRLAHHSVSADGHGMWWLITSWRSLERRWVVEVVECVQLLRCMMNPRRSDLSTILSVRMVMTCGD